MKRLFGILTVLCLCLVGCASMNIPVPAPKPIKFGGATSTSINAGQPNVTNITVTGSCTKVVPEDGTNLDWLIFAENNDIRCLPQYYGTCTNVPTSTSGFLIKGAGATLSSYPLSDPTDEVDCIATGSSSSVSLWIDKRE